ncbi:MAG TPA: YihY family inner membrane protein [Macromonas sp.]|nr:YihY family inner membrane protein [Macromonas sp.]
MKHTPGFTQRFQAGRQWLHALWRDLGVFPWQVTAQTLRERFREDRLGVTAGSLAFTTMISLVPLLTVGLAIFSAFPMFERLEPMLQKWLIESLIPDNIARQVSNYLFRFADKASRMGWLGALFLLGTALAMVLTIDRKLNDIWRVRQFRPLPQRVLVYWAVLTLGPLLLAGSLSLSSYALSASKGWVGGLHSGFLFFLDSVEFVVTVFALAALYRYVPNARVRWSHALVGGLFVSLGLEGAKRLVAWYLIKVPTYSAVYGTFATVPILLVWLYMAWVILLLGAVVVAYLPSLLAGIARRGDSPGWHFQLALEMLTALHHARTTDRRGLSLEDMALQLRVDPLQLEGPLEVLLAMDWVGRLAESRERFVLLAEPQSTPLAPLVQQLLLPLGRDTRALWDASHWSRLQLGQVLPT